MAKAEVLARLEPLPREGVRLNEVAWVRHVATRGLSRAEEHGRWTDGGRAQLAFRLPERPEAGVTLFLQSLGFVAPGFVNEQRVGVAVNGTALPDLVARDTVMRTRAIEVPPEAIRPDGVVVLDLLVSTCVQPALLGISNDDRFLGILLSTVTPRRAGASGRAGGGVAMERPSR